MIDAKLLQGLMIKAKLEAQMLVTVISFELRKMFILHVTNNFRLDGAPLGGENCTVQ
jgi:hypothetical protein